jgi:predicted dehydrogenase
VSAEENKVEQNRREFIKTTAVGMSTWSASSRNSILGANERMNIGIIGVGGQGTSHLTALTTKAESYKCRVAAVCDVYRRRVSRAKEKSGAEGFPDYRELLARKDIDAVIIAAPDHWHSKMSIEALAAGKHVYCEKPMTLTIEQAFEVRAAVRRYGRTFQVGTNRNADDRYWKSQKLIRAGKIGKVTWAQGGYNRNIKGDAFNAWFPIDETAGPGRQGDDFINWDLWLGHEWNLAPRIAWNPEHFFRFRKYWPYNGGVATDLLYHFLSPLLIAIVGNNGEYPRRVNASGGLYLLKDGREIPDVFLMNADFPSEFTVSLTSVLTNNTPVPTRIYGQYGTVEIPNDADRAGQGTEMTVSGNGDYLKEFRELNDGYSTVTITKDERPDMRMNFFDCIRTGGIPFCNVELGTATMVGIKMGVESYRQSRTMLWDAAKEIVL